MQEAVELEAQLACKEREWKELKALWIRQLETALNEATSELSTPRECFLCLRDDFKYKLCVLEERDKELERYGALAARAQTVKEDIEMQCQRRGIEHRVNFERVQSMMEYEIQKLQEENETLKRDLRQGIRESDGELALQKQEMMADFDSEMRKRVHEFHLKLDEMNSVVLSHELKQKAGGPRQNSQASEELYQQAQKEIQCRDKDLKNTTTMKDSRSACLALDVLKFDMCRHAELERRSRVKEDALGLIREANARELQEISELQAQLDMMIVEQERREKSYMDDLHHRDQQILELRVQLETTRSGWDTCITQISKENVAKDTELLSAGEREAKGRRCEEVRSEHYLRSEELTQSRTQARDQVSAVDSSSFPSEEIRRLQQQNSTLRAVVDNNALTKEDSDLSISGTTGYSQTLEKEILELKAKCCDFEERLEKSFKTVNTDSIPALKVACAAALKKQEVRLAHLESSVEQFTQQCHSKHMENESLCLELENHKRAAAAEEARLKQRVAAAELELNEVRREAEEYQKGSLLHNLESVTLGNQASFKYIEFNFNQYFSEMVKQLQEENLSPRQQLLLLQSFIRGGTVGDVASLQSKLKQAALLISSLSQDKRQLIEMGNRLRAQLIEDLNPHHFVLSGGVATANGGHPDINQLLASLQEKKKQSHTTFAPAKMTHPAGNKSKIQNYNIKNWKKALFGATPFKGLSYLK
uniref:Uncharacterized protein n=1 Tax=Cyprinus carpio TaxID=7962 RepID=A0A8C1KNV4_CYPCA